MSAARGLVGRCALGAALLGSSDRALALDPAQRITQFARDVWQTDDGLPQESIYTIAQTRDGYLWLGTDEGLVRFDGVRFTVFDKRNTPALWIGTDGGGVARLEAGRFQTYAQRDGLSSNFVTSLLQDPQGTLWVGTMAGLNRLAGERFESYTKAATPASSRSRGRWPPRCTARETWWRATAARSSR